jgi:hypothetical protein
VVKGVVVVSRDTAVQQLAAANGALTLAEPPQAGLNGAIQQGVRLAAIAQAHTTRLDLAINAVLLFSYVALKRGDRVGMLTFAGQIQHYIPPRPGSS